MTNQNVFELAYFSQLLIKSNLKGLNKQQISTIK